jgi:hypothetical protein
MSNFVNIKIIELQIIFLFIQKHYLMKNLSAFFLFFLCLLSSKSFATHNYAGEIIVEQTGPLTIKATIVTYYPATTTVADRPELFMNWGDGMVNTVTRSNGKGELLDDNTTKKNVYTSTHTFTTGGKYTVWMTDPNRTGGILNLNFPQSELVAFVLQTTVTLVGVTSNQKYNSTPVFKNFSIYPSYVGKPVVMDNKATDADGDSVSYRLVTPFQSLFKSVFPFSPVTDIQKGENNKLTLNPITGLLTWDAPQKAGNYSIAMQAISYRNGVAIDTTLRDMLITIEEKTTTALDELSEKPLAQLLGNPMKGESVLIFDGDLGAVTLSAFDLSGKMLKQVNLNNPQSHILTQADLGSGIKLIKIKAARREQVLKIVIE